ncbi:MAG: TetR/AcrR family transcriptional regulator [Ectothiorhodospiraceae bacterium]|nr:TetR/AcrR family transcriptional regulator [Ectothiorhodospiraceae bacterium]
MPRGRPIAFNQSEALNAAMQVFWARGYDAASTRVLQEAMHLSRSSLYQHFGNKETLFVRCLDQYRENLLRRLERRLDEAPSAMVFLRELFLDTAESAASDRARLGCLIFNSATELGYRQDLPGERTRLSVARITALFGRALRRAQASGELDPRQDTAALADFLTLGMAGLRTLIKAGADPERARAAAHCILQACRKA